MTRPSRRDVLRAAGTLAALPLLDGATAHEGPRDDGPPRPGPDYLYGEHPTPPQLENGDGWAADPLLVSGAEAYVDGEYLYQDYVYDDRGADTARGPVPPTTPTGDYVFPTDAANFAPPTGDYVYPTDEERYGYNAADLLEFRARPTADGVAYRVTLNTMLTPDAAAVAVGIDTGERRSRAGGGSGSGRRTDWGYGLGDLGAPVDRVLVHHGTGAELDGEPLSDGAVSVDTEQNQLEVEVPLRPGATTWRHYLVVGLWDPDAGAFAQVAPTPDAKTPGGSHPERPVKTPPVFNVGFRFEEPYGFANLDAGSLGDQVRDLARTDGSRQTSYGSWREHGQANALAERDISALHADVDFGVLRRGTTDLSGVPETGYLSLLYPSRLSGEGVDAAANEFDGRIQPYSAYVPSSYDGDPTPALLFMHSLGFAHSQYVVYTPALLRQLGEENGTIVFTPEGRGPSGWYQRRAEVDVFEAFRDVRRRFAVDADRVSVGGYSMGGYGTYKLASQFPDLFARGFAVVGPPDEEVLGGPTGNRLDGLIQFTEDPENAMRIADNLRHVPLLMWAGANDELVPLPGVLNYEQHLRELGYRHELDVFPGYDHFMFAFRDQWGPGASFLDGAAVTRSPPRVTYRRVPDFDHPDLGLVHDGAYWVNDIEVREGTDSGLVDAVSRADGYAEPATAAVRGLGTDPAPHTKRGTRWTRSRGESGAENALEVTLEGVAAAMLWLTETGLDLAGLTLRASSDGPATLTLVGASAEREVTVGAGGTEITLE